MILKLFQLSGHRPIALMGGATGRIGDPSGRDKERELKPIEELDGNLAEIQKLLGKFLDFDQGKNKALLLNNYDFYKDMGVFEFLRDIGKYITVNYMQSKDSVKKRLEGESGMSFTEFSYQVIQGYDYVRLNKEHGCTLQMGGSDQWGNITTGTHMIGKMTDGAHAYAVTTPLLTKADGAKFGKSEEGNIWISSGLTSPYKFYQFWINASDADVSKFTRYFSLKSRGEVEAMERELADNPQERKRLLAEELTMRVHSMEDFENVLKVSQLLFSKKATREALLDLSEKVLSTVAGEIPAFPVSIDLLKNGVEIADLLAGHTAIVASKGEARRAIQGNAVSVNKEKVSSHDTTINHEQLLHGKYMMIENGKKNKFMIIAR